MKCIECKTGELKVVTVSRDVHVDVAGTIQVYGINVRRCNHCDAEMIDETELNKETRRVLRILLERYQYHNLPGKVGSWIRQAVGLSEAELAHKVRSDDLRPLLGNLPPGVPFDSRKVLVIRRASFIIIRAAEDFIAGVDGANGT
jgi:hypothetical protein